MSIDTGEYPQQLAVGVTSGRMAGVSPPARVVHSRCDCCRGSPRMRCGWCGPPTRECRLPVSG